MSPLDSQALLRYCVPMTNTAPKTFYYLTGDPQSLHYAAELADMAGVLKHADTDKVVIYATADDYAFILKAATTVVEA